MNIYITSRGLYAVETLDRTFETFTSLLKANNFVMDNGASPVYTWFN